MITFKNITKKYKDRTVIKDMNLEIPKGQTVVLIGPSGCGKTTTLKMINRLITPTSGTILIHGKGADKKNLTKLRRNIGYVIQQTGLFPHMTIKENIEIIPRLEKMPQKQIDERTDELLEITGLSKNHLYRYPNQLSGGQQQRVGVARALALDPDIVLMDEPFSALDPITKSQLQDELINIQEQERKTIVFVTHDMNEAVKIADLMCIMNKGEVVQYDTPENIMKNPINEFVEEFVGKNRIWQSPEFIKASDIMMEPFTIHPDSSLFRVIDRMRANHIEHIAVTGRNREFKGMATARAILKEDDKSIRVIEIADINFPKVTPDEPITEILKLFKDHRITSVPVVDENGKIMGTVDQTSLITVLNKQFLEEE